MWPWEKRKAQSYGQKPWYDWVFGGELGIRTLETFRSTAFRVLHLRPLGQLSVSIFIRFSFQKFAQKFVGEKTGEKAKNIRFWDFLCWGISRRIRGTKFPVSAEISSQPRYDHFDTSPYDVTPFILLYSAGKCKGVEKGDWQKSKTFRKKRKKAIDYFRLMW